MLLLELQEVRLLCGDLLRQDVLQRRQGSLAAAEVPEGALVCIIPRTNVRDRGGERRDDTNYAVGELDGCAALYFS